MAYDDGQVTEMMKSVPATIEKDGQVRLCEPVHLTHPCRAIVTIIEEPDVPETALLSEPALADDWDKPEEDEAWYGLTFSRRRRPREIPVL